MPTRWTKIVLIGCSTANGTTRIPTRVPPPGGWAWTDLPGGVPETDDTAGALIALARGRHRYPQLKQHRLQLAARRGVEWLLELQNSDGGWPTFCRGWSMLPFDRSATDVTAHAVRALAAWQKAWQSRPASCAAARRSRRASRHSHRARNEVPGKRTTQRRQFRAALVRQSVSSGGAQPRVWNGPGADRLHRIGPTRWRHGPAGGALVAGCAACQRWLGAAAVVASHLALEYLSLGNLAG